MKLILVALALMLALTLTTPAHALVVRCHGINGHCAPRIVRH